VLYSDRTITCSDCGADFPFSAAEQEFFEQKGFRFPRRCKECRKAKKDGGGGGGARAEGGGGGGRAGGGGADRGETWPATCTQCGAETTYGERKTSRGGGRS
jgi:hypothetical protein